MSDSLERPAWAAPEVFPVKPATAPFGALSKKAVRTEFDSFEALEAHVGSSRQSVVAVWTPEAGRMVPPEAVVGLLEPLRKRFVDLAQGDFANARRNSMIFGGLLLWAVVYAAFSKKVLPQDSQNVGLAGLLLLMLGLIPLYEAWKSRRSGWNLNAENLAEEEREARFECWMDAQPMRLNYVLLFLMLFVGVAQIWVGVDKSVEVAGLTKVEGAESWRYLTAPFLHGNLLHWGLNAAALFYLGRRTESLMGWPHILLGFLVAMLAGGIATDHFVPGSPSIGASGGVLGVLGMLMAFELLHSRLVPKSARRRLMAGVLVTFVIGLVGYQFVDNAAHAGGLVAGFAYSLIVFPKSRSARRPKVNRLDRMIGGLAGLVLTASALWAFWQMVAS